MLGLKTAQVACRSGPTTLSTVVHEKIYHEAGAETPQEATVAEIRRLIAEAGRIPVERDTRTIASSATPARGPPANTSKSRV